jgi:replicative DNA helicase
MMDRAAVKAPTPMPADPDAEASVVGAGMGPFARDVIPVVSEVIGPEAFSVLSLGHIFAAELTVLRRGETPDLVLVRYELERTGMLEAAGGPMRLVELHTSSEGGAGRALAHARIVAVHHWRRRALIAIEDARLAVQESDDSALGRALTELERCQSSAVTTAGRSQIVSGGSFALDVSDKVPAVWGADDLVAWAEGEPALLVGPAGVGKTTVAQRAALARIGLLDEVLGMPVAPSSAGRVLYVAADRPAQAQRSLRRMVDEADRELLDERLVIWRGPLHVDIATEPAALLELARRHGADTVVLDSLKDVALDLVKDETGQRLHVALQTAVTGGVEVLALHHQRKAQAGGGKPKTLADVYGSTWITAGAGSVLLLWGEAGDPVVELSHLKQPAGQIGPLTVVHDALTGDSRVEEQPTVHSVLAGAARGITALGLAAILWDASDRNAVEKARRQLDGLVRSGRAHRVDGHKGGGKDRDPTIYYPVAHREEQP